jgi:hypothetical protein
VDEQERVILAVASGDMPREFFTDRVGDDLRPDA